LIYSVVGPSVPPGPFVRSAQLSAQLATSQQLTSWSLDACCHRLGARLDRDYYASVASDRHQHRITERCHPPSTDRLMDLTDAGGRQRAGMMLKAWPVGRLSR